MDLNQLYSDHQLSLVRAGKSAPAQRRMIEAEACRTAMQIREFQRSLGANAAAGWDRLATGALEGEPARTIPGSSN